MNDLITIREAVELLSVTLQTLRNWDKKGILIPMRTPTKQRRYSRDLIMKLLEKNYDA